MLFLKRLEDDGGVVHMNARDREVIEMFQAQKKTVNPLLEYSD